MQANAVDHLSSIDPTLAAVRQEHRNYYDEELPYVLMGDFALVVLGWVRDQREDPLTRFFGALDEILRTGDAATRNLVVVGLLESLQNSADSVGISSDDVAVLLGAEGRKAWHELDAFWGGPS